MVEAVTGTVKWWNNDKGMGYVVVNGHEVLITRISMLHGIDKLISYLPLWITFGENSKRMKEKYNLFEGDLVAIDKKGVVLLKRAAN